MVETGDRSDCDLSQMRMFDGSNFAAWRECMLQALTQRGLHGPLSGDVGRPSRMSDDQWQELDEMALSMICLHLVESIFALVMHEATTRAVWQRLHEMYDGSELSETHVRQRHSRRRRQVTCWHCGHPGHTRRRCFRRMRQRRRHGCLTDADALTVEGADTVSEYMSDGDVTFASSPDVLMLDCVLPSQWLLDADATFHVTSHREWFCSYSSGMLGSVHMTDGSVHKIAGAGDVRLSLPSGASYLLRHVRYVPDLRVSLISVGQLRDCGCRISLRERDFTMHLGSLVIARGARCGMLYPLHVDHMRDSVISVVMQSGRERETRRVSFADELRDARVEQVVELAVQVMSTGSGRIERDCSSESQQGESSYVMAEMADWDAEESVIMQSFLDMLLSETDGIADALQDAQSIEFVVHDTLMRDRHVEQGSSSETRHKVVVQESMHGELEQVSSSETQQIQSSCWQWMVADEAEMSAILQSFLTMLDSEHGDLVVQDMSSSRHLEQLACSEVARQVDVSFVDSQEIHVADTPCQSEMPIARDIYVDACSIELAGPASIASAFGGLMYEMLISRPDLAAAVGAFVAELIGRTVTDHGIEHGGVMRVLDRYLQECMSSSRHFAELGVSSVWLPHQRVCLPVEPDARAHRQSVGIG